MGERRGIKCERIAAEVRPAGTDHEAIQSTPHAVGAALRTHVPGSPNNVGGVLSGALNGPGHKSVVEACNSLP